MRTCRQYRLTASQSKDVSRLVFVALGSLTSYSNHTMHVLNPTAPATYWRKDASPAELMQAALGQCLSSIYPLVRNLLQKYEACSASLLPQSRHQLLGPGHFFSILRGHVLIAYELMASPRCRLRLHRHTTKPLPNLVAMPRLAPSPAPAPAKALCL